MMDITKLESWISEQLDESRAMHSTAEDYDDESYDTGFYQGRTTQCVLILDKLKEIKGMNNSFEETNRIIREAGTGWDNVADPIKALEDLRRESRCVRCGGQGFYTVISVLNGGVLPCEICNTATTLDGHQ